MAYWFDIIDEEKKHGKKSSSKTQGKLMVTKTPAATTRKVKPFFSTKLQLKRNALESL